VCLCAQGKIRESFWGYILSSQITDDLVKLFDGLVRKRLEDYGCRDVNLDSEWIRREAGNAERQLRLYRDDLERYIVHSKDKKDDGGLELRSSLQVVVDDVAGVYISNVESNRRIKGVRAPKPERPTTTETYPAEAQRSITRINTYGLVRELRQEFFKQDTPPFLWSYSDSYEWVKANSVEPGHETDQVTFTAKLEGETSDKAFLMLQNALGQPGQHAAASLHALADALEDENVRFQLLESVKLEIGPKMGKPAQRRYIPERVSSGVFWGGEEIKVTGIFVHSPHVLSVWAAGGPALDLWHKAERVSDASEGHWSQQQALDYILTGTGYIDGVVIEKFLRGAPWQPRGIPWRFTITLNATTTPDDLAKYYAQELERQGLRAVRLSKTQQKLLELEADTPGMVWRERADIWTEWCKQDRELEPFGEPKHKILRTQASRAKDRADWQPSKTATTVPPLTPNKPKSKPVKS
jgi:hypothetical protein